MAQITLNIPDQHLPRVVHALCRAGGWPPEEESAANARKHLIAILKQMVLTCEAEEAQETSDIIS